MSWITSMLVTDVGDQMDGCVGDKFRDVGDKSRHQHQELGINITFWRIMIMVTDVNRTVYSL